VLGPARAQPLEVAGGIGEPVRMVDPQAVDRALACQLQRQLVRLGEDALVLLAHGGQVVDVEEAAVAAGALVDVEEAVPQRRVGPVAVRVVGRHVVGHDVEDQPDADAARGGGQRVELALAAELVRELAGIDDVVAVRGARPRLERRRQVQVADAEIAQVRQQLARLREPHGAAELEPVCRAERGH
jgi:hypothetical protein